MTVNVQDPYRNLIADGVLTTFTFDFGYVETLDVYVVVNGLTLTEYSDYTINSTDIGVSETSSTSIGHSLQLSGDQSLSGGEHSSSTNGSAGFGCIRSLYGPK